MEYLIHYWWVGVIILLLALYKLIFRVLGIIIVPEDKIGLVTKKFVLFGSHKELPPGSHTQEWDAKGFTSGVYYYRLQTRTYGSVKKMLLLK